MKKSTRNILLIALAMICIGAVLVGISYFSTGGNIGFEYNRESGLKPLSHPGKLIYQKLDGSVDDIEIIASGSRIKIVKAKEFAIEYNKNVPIDYMIEDSTLTINYEKDYSKRVVYFMSFRTRESSLTVYVPNDFDLDSLHVESEIASCTIDGVDAKDLYIDLDLGSLTIKNMSVDDLEVDLSSGSCNLTNFESTNSTLIDVSLGSFHADKSMLARANISMGLGSLNGSKLTLTDANIDSGSGSINVDGVLLGESHVSASLGSINFELIGKRSDYMISHEVELGSTKIQGSNPSSADNSIDINSGMGSVNVSFSK